MKTTLVIALALVATAAAAAVTQPPLPNSPPLNYYVKLNFMLPEMNVTEDTEVWYDGVLGFQKIAFYDGMDTYLFRSASNTTFGSYFVTPANTKTECQVMTSNSQTFRTAVGALPDIPTEMYTWAGEETVNGVECYKYYLNEVIAGTSNNYTYYIAANDSMTPIRMEMIGFNGYLGQLNYDWFVVDFLEFSAGVVTEDDFEIPSLCQPNSPDRVDGAYVPPPSQLVHRFKPQPHSEMFEEFKALHGRTYHPNSNEHAARLAVFAANTDKVNRLNQLNARSGKADALRLTVNHFGDRLPEEMSAMRGHKTRQGPNNAAGYHQVSVSDPSELPSEINWNTKGAVSPQKEQGDCGSCWSFSTTGALESANYLYGTKTMELFSEQYLMDCTFNYGGNIACGGGDQSVAYDFLLANGGGIPTEADYPYLENNAYCKSNATMTGTISKYYNLTAGNNTEMMDALATVGPIAISIDASLFDFTFYSGGVYSNPACLSGNDDLDHAVLTFGYGTSSSGSEVYYVKNQWSVYWGNQGVAMFARGDDLNTCGILTAGLYPVV